MKDDELRRLLLAAAEAGAGGRLDPPIALTILAGDPDFRLERLDFDSLAVMEFCISIELQCKAEITPDLLAAMETMAEVEAWLRSQLTDAV